jgi:hypothetical protein
MAPEPQKSDKRQRGKTVQLCPAPFEGNVVKQSIPVPIGQNVSEAQIPKSIATFVG